MWTIHTRRHLRAVSRGPKKCIPHSGPHPRPPGFCGAGRGRATGPTGSCGGRRGPRGFPKRSGGIEGAGTNGAARHWRRHSRTKPRHNGARGTFLRGASNFFPGQTAAGGILHVVEVHQRRVVVRAPLTEKFAIPAFLALVAQDLPGNHYRGRGGGNPPSPSPRRPKGLSSYIYIRAPPGGGLTGSRTSKTDQNKTTSTGFLGDRNRGGWKTFPGSRFPVLFWLLARRWRRPTGARPKTPASNRQRGGLRRLLLHGVPRKRRARGLVRAGRVEGSNKLVPGGFLNGPNFRPWMVAGQGRKTAGSRWGSLL